MESTALYTPHIIGEEHDNWDDEQKQKRTRKNTTSGISPKPTRKLTQKTNITVEKQKDTPTTPTKKIKMDENPDDSSNGSSYSSSGNDEPVVKIPPRKPNRNRKKRSLSSAGSTITVTTAKGQKKV